MLRKIIAAGVVFAAGYILGVTFGFRAAVVDYVEEDAEKIEQMADSIYSSDGDGESHDQEALALQEALEESRADEKTNGAEASDDEPSAFQ